MSRSARNLARAALPPILTLGLVPLMIRPMDATPVGTATQVSAGHDLPSTGGGHATCPSRNVPRIDTDGVAGRESDKVTARPMRRAENVAVSISAVAFTRLIQVVDGRVHTPVLVNVAESCGMATVVGSPGLCSVVARPGVVAWLDCALPKQHATVTLEVRLQDGRMFSHTTGLTPG